MVVKCCVPGCTHDVPRRHRFPNPKTELERLLKWRELIGGKLLDADPKYLYDAKRVCEKHFEKTCLSPGTTRLKHNAIPTLFMPGNVLPSITSNLQETSSTVPFDAAGPSTSAIVPVPDEETPSIITGIQPDASTTPVTPNSGNLGQ